MRSFSSLVILLAICTVNLSAHATEYWAALGSFRDSTGAERAMADASSRLSESFAIVPSDTPGGFYYRVLAGPYQTRALAEQSVLNAKQQGFGDAWLLAVAAQSLQPVSTLGGGSLDATFDASFDAPLDASLDGGTRDTTPLNTSGVPFEPASGEIYQVERTPLGADQDRKPPPTLVDEAPTDYQLHKLQRR